MDDAVLNLFGPIPDVLLVAYLNGYFDESGKSAKDKVVSFCGFADSDWDLFASKWSKLLRRYRLPALHLSKDKLKATAKNLSMYREFIKVIKQSIECGFGCAVDVPSFTTIHKSVASELGGSDPQFLAFITVLKMLKEYTRVSRDPSISIICDDDREKACNTYKLYMRAKQRYNESARIFVGIGFADDVHYMQLQAADLFSWITRAEALHRYHGESYSLRELFGELNTSGPDVQLKFQAKFWDQEQISDYSARVDRELSKKHF